jgi:hypothetical protein
MSVELLKNALALVYRKKGKDTLNQKDLELIITMDFQWFTPKEAQLLVDQGLKSKLILKQKKGLKINFDWQNRDIPMGFKPSDAILKEAEHRSCFTAIVDSIENQVDIDRKQIVAEINEKQEILNVAIEVAALLIAAHHGVNISDFYEPVEHELTARFS